MFDICVVIPCFNLGEFVEEAVESALSQEGAPSRVILIDDGSTDDATKAKCEEIGALNRVDFIRTENRGVAAARNLGIGQAREKFICFLDADDKLLPGALKKMTDALDDNPEAALAYPAYRRMDTGESVYRPAFSRLALCYTNTLSIASLVRQSAIGDARFRTTDRGFEYEDWDFWLQITKDSPAVHVPEVLYEYRCRQTGRGRQGNRHHLEVIEDLRRFHSDSFSPASMMETKRRYCPAVSILTDRDETFASWRKLLRDHPYMDAEVLRAGRLPRVDVNRREKFLGKYILRDTGDSAPNYEVFASALKAFENFEHLFYWPKGWAFSLAKDMDMGLDPTSELAHLFAEENDLQKLSEYHERLWRLSCPAWCKSHLPRDPDDPAGEKGRAANMMNMIKRLNLVPYAIFGAGQHTRRLLDANVFSPKPVTIFDDNPKSENICGVPILSPTANIDIHAVIVSSDANERMLYKRAKEVFPSNIPIFRLYS